MEVQAEKFYKSKQCVRDAMKKYKSNIKQNDPERYNEMLKFHRAYNKQYYNKVKEERAQLKLLLQQLQ